jgi:hypothetical protein
MNKQTILTIWIVLLIILLLGGVFIGAVYYNIPMGAFPPILTALSMIFLGIDRIFFKKKRESIPVPTKELKLRASIAKCAGLTVFAVIMGIVVGLNTISYFEKAGRHPSAFWLFPVLIGMPTAGVIFYLNKRSEIIKNMSNEEDAPDPNPVK